MKRPIQRLRYRIGRRGAALMFFALVDLVYAVSLASPPPEVRAQPSFTFMVKIFPLQAWAALWAMAGLACLIQAFTADDRIAFVFSSWLNVGWGCVNLAGFLAGEIPRGYVSAVIFLGYAGFIQLIAGWRENRENRGPEWTQQSS